MSSTSSNSFSNDFLFTLTIPNNLQLDTLISYINKTQPFYEIKRITDEHDSDISSFKIQKTRLTLK